MNVRLIPKEFSATNLQISNILLSEFFLNAHFLKRPKIIPHVTHLKIEFFQK
jgi:hypothetical protein